MQELPFQEGRPLSPIVEEGESSTKLLEYRLRANHSPDRQVCMASLRNAEEDELGTQYDNEQLADVSADEPTAATPQDEDEEHQRIWRAKNAKRAQRRRIAQNGAREPRDLHNAFAAVADCEYHTLICAIAEAVLLAQQLSSNPQIQRLQYLTQCTLVQLDGKHPVSSARNQLSRSEQHGNTALVSCSPRGGHGSRRNDNRQRNEGHPSARGNNEQEVQQPPRNQCGARHHGQNPVEANLNDAPTVDLRQNINEGRDSWLIIKARRKDHFGGTTTMTTATVSPPSPPASPTSPTPRTSNHSESPSMMISRTHASGFVVTPSPLKFQGYPTPQKLSTSRWLWSLHPSRGLKASSQNPSTRGRTSSGLSSTTSRDP
jgi:hypothetical protein